MQDLEIHEHYQEIHLESSVLVLKQNKKNLKWKLNIFAFFYLAIGFVHCLGISDRSLSGVIGIGTLDKDAIGSLRSPTFGSVG